MTKAFISNAWNKANGLSMFSQTYGDHWIPTMYREGIEKPRRNRLWNLLAPTQPNGDSLIHRTIVNYKTLYRRGLTPQVFKTPIDLTLNAATRYARLADDEQERERRGSLSQRTSGYIVNGPGSLSPRVQEVIS